VRQGMAILVMSSRETLVVVRATEDRAFFRPFSLVCKHVSFQVFEPPSAFLNWALIFFSAIFLAIFSGTWACLMRVA